MRIAVVNDWWEPDLVGGAEHTALSIARGLANAHDVSVFVPSANDAEDDINGIHVLRVHVPVVRPTPQSSLLRKLPENLAGLLLPGRSGRLIGAVKGFNPHAVLVHNSNRLGPSFLGRITEALPSSRVLHIHHDLTDLCWRRTMFRRGRACVDVCRQCRPRATLAIQSHRGVFRCFAVSNYVAEMLGAANVHGCRPTTVGYPLAIQRHRCSTPAGSEVLRVGFMGRVVREKGLGNLIEAAALVQRQRSIEVLVAGVGSPRFIRQMKRLAHRRGVPTTFSGRMSPREVAARVDVVVVPSLWPEPLGRVPLEFAALGTPSLVTPVGGLPETALQAPECIGVLPSAEPASIASCLLEFPRHESDSDLDVHQFQSLLQAVQVILAETGDTGGGN